MDATIAFNGGGRRFVDDVLHSMAAEQITKTITEEELAKNTKGLIEFSGHALRSKPFDLRVSGHGYNWWHEMLSIDQLKTLNKANSPLLIVQNGNYLSAAPEKVDELITALRYSSKANIDYLRYAELDHYFEDADGLSQRKAEIFDMRAWLEEKLN